MKNKTLQTISRWILALLFIFSGLAKSVNPFGFSVQLGEYLGAMGLAFLKPLAPLGSIALPSIEVLLGVMLAMGLGRKISAWGVTIFMSFFTVLTLWIAIANPVSDCGCFGDILIISNWHTFIKNLVLLPFAIILFINRNEGISAKNLLYIVAVPVSFALATYSYFNLPLIDATPYKIGTNIIKAMTIPENADQGESHTTLIYKNIKTGKTQEFEIEDPRWQDESTWEYADTRTTVIREGYVPPIKNLPMLDSLGNDHATRILSLSGKVLLVVTNDSMDMYEICQISNMYSGSVVMLTSTMQSTEGQGGYSPEILMCDHTVISTIIQNSTGGAIELENGTIVRKMVMRQVIAMEQEYRKW